MPIYQSKHGRAGTDLNTRGKNIASALDECANTTYKIAQKEMCLAKLRTSQLCPCMLVASAKKTGR